MKKYLTKETLEKLKKELEELKTVKRKEIAERLKHTASFGDLSENFAYQQAKEDQAFIEGKILKLEQIINNAEAIETVSRDKVQLGSIVTLDSQGKNQKFQIVEPEEAVPQEGKISFKSPLGESLLGKSVGDVVKISTPDGEIKYKIVKIN